jgi:hypothetical protein
MARQLYVYEVHCGEGKDWLVAYSDGDAVRLMRKRPGLFIAPVVEYWITRLPSDHKISIPCNSKGELVDYRSSRKKTRTCAEWAKLQGRGHLCGEDY